MCSPCLLSRFLGGDGQDLCAGAVQMIRVVRGVQGQRAVQAGGIEKDLGVFQQRWIDDELEVRVEAERQDGAADAAGQCLRGAR